MRLYGAINQAEQGKNRLQENITTSYFIEKARILNFFYRKKNHITGAVARYPRIRWVVLYNGAAIPSVIDRVAMFAEVILGAETEPLACIARGSSSRDSQMSSA